MTVAARLDAALKAAGIPIHGVSIGRDEDRATWRIDYAPEATVAERQQGETIRQTFQATDPIVQPAPQLTREAFYDLFRDGQRSLIFDLAETDKRVRDLVRRVDIGERINLGDPRVSLGMQLLKALGVFGADPVVADTEIARILANQPPTA